MSSQDTHEDNRLYNTTSGEAAPQKENSVRSKVTRVGDGGVSRRCSEDRAQDTERVKDRRIRNQTSSPLSSPARPAMSSDSQDSAVSA